MKNAIAELGKQISRYIKPNTKPVRYVDAYYQTNRSKPTLPTNQK